MTSSSYRKLPATLWDDLQPLSPETQRFAFYLLTTPHRTTEGLFRLKPAYAAADTGFEFSAVQEHLKALAASGFIELDLENDVVLIVDALKWDSPRSSNNVKHAIRQLSTLPATPLLKRLHDLAVSACPALATEIATQFELGTQPSPEPSPNEVPHSPSPSPSPSPETPTGVSRPIASKLEKAREKATDDDKALCRLLAEHIKSRNPKFKVKAESEWLDQMRLLRERDDNPPADIRRLIDWVFTSGERDAEFWARTVQSTSNLRENFARIWGQMIAGHITSNGTAPTLAPVGGGRFAHLDKAAGLQ